MKLPFKFIIFDLDTTEPVDVALSVKEAQGIMADLNGTGRFAVKPFKKYFLILQKEDPKKYALLVVLAEKKIEDSKDEL